MLKEIQMYKGIKILAIIPARGGSKGLPNKNIKHLLGKPLINYTIEQANKSKYIDNLVVSTDDLDIRQTALNAGANVVHRPDILARDESPVSETIIHALDFCKYEQGLQYDVVLMLECTSPLRKPDDIDNAIQMFCEDIGHYDSLIAVAELTSDTEHPYCVRVEEDGYLQPFIKDAPPIYQRQQLNKAYSVFGGMYMTSVYKYRQSLTFYQDRIMAYYVERWQKFEIDDIIDFICVEAVMKSKGIIDNNWEVKQYTDDSFSGMTKNKFYLTKIDNETGPEIKVISDNNKVIIMEKHRFKKQ